MKVDKTPYALAYLKQQDLAEKVFAKLAEKYAHHNTRHNQHGCSICEGILAILGGQYELEAIADATGFDDDKGYSK